MSTQSIVGVIIQACMAGIIFAKFTVPRKRGQTIGVVFVLIMLIYRVSQQGYYWVFKGFIAGFPFGFPTGFSTGFPTGFPTEFPRGFLRGFPTGIPTGSTGLAHERFHSFQQKCGHNYAQWRPLPHMSIM